MLEGSRHWISAGLLVAGLLATLPFPQAQSRSAPCHYPILVGAGISTSPPHYLIPQDQFATTMRRLLGSSVGCTPEGNDEALDSMSDSEYGKFMARTLADRIAVNRSIELYELNENEAVTAWQGQLDSIYGDVEGIVARIGRRRTPAIQDQVLLHQIRLTEALEKELAQKQRVLSSHEGRHIDGRYTETVSKSVEWALVALDVVGGLSGTFPAGDESAKAVAERVAGARASMHELLVQLDAACVLWWGRRMTVCEENAGKYETKVAKGQAIGMEAGLLQKATVILTDSARNHRALIDRASRSGVSVEGITTPYDAGRMSALKTRADELVERADALTKGRKAEKSLAVAAAREAGAKAGVPLKEDYAFLGQASYTRFGHRWSNEVLAETYTALVSLAKLEPPRDRRQIKKQVGAIPSFRGVTRTAAMARKQLLQVPESDPRRAAALAEHDSRLALILEWGTAYEKLLGGAPAREAVIAPVPEKWSSDTSPTSDVGSASPPATRGPDKRAMLELRRTEFKKVLERERVAEQARFDAEIQRYDDATRKVAIQIHRRVVAEDSYSGYYDTAELAFAVVDLHIQRRQDPRLESSDPIERAKAREDVRQREEEFSGLGDGRSTPYLHRLVTGAEKSGVISSPRLRATIALRIWSMSYSTAATEDELDALAACVADRIEKTYETTPLAGPMVVDRQYMEFIKACKRDLRAASK